MPHLLIPNADKEKREVFAGTQGEVWKELRRRNRKWHRDHPQEREGDYVLPARRSYRCLAGTHSLCSGFMSLTAHGGGVLIPCPCWCRHTKTATVRRDTEDAKCIAAVIDKRLRSRDGARWIRRCKRAAIRHRSPQDKVAQWCSSHMEHGYAFRAARNT